MTKALKPYEQARLALLKDTFSHYYSPDGTPIPGRHAIDDDGTCVYNREDGTRCAIGRIWTEFHGRVEGVCQSLMPSNKTESNRALAWRLAQRDGLASDDESETVAWLRDLQSMHDYANGRGTTSPVCIYGRLLEGLGQAVQS